MTFCNKRLRLNRMLNMAIKIESARSEIEGRGFSMAGTDIEDLQRRVARYNVIHNLLVKTF
ncbi:MAG: hypothetical protein ACRDB0_02050 [Paraclostridium sp.]